MEIPKPTDEDRERFSRVVPSAPGVVVKPMFGNLGAFINGNMFMGLLGADIGLKLDGADLAKLLAEPGGGPFGPAGRPMGGYAVIPAAWTDKKAQAWAAKALEHVAAFPPKKAKTAKKPDADN